MHGHKSWNLPQSCLQRRYWEKVNHQTTQYWKNKFFDCMMSVQVIYLHAYRDTSENNEQFRPVFGDSGRNSSLSHTQNCICGIMHRMGQRQLFQFCLVKQLPKEI